MAKNIIPLIQNNVDWNNVFFLHFSSFYGFFFNFIIRYYIDRDFRACDLFQFTFFCGY
jgi:hypothetical protein